MSFQISIKLMLMMHGNLQARLIQTMMMAVNPEKKERTIKGDRCDSAKNPLIVMSVFSLGQRWKILSGQNLPLVDGTCSFYREFDVGLLIWDPSPSWVMWVVMKKMGCVEQSLWNSFHIPSNVSYFAYVEPLENFWQNLPSTI